MLSQVTLQLSSQKLYDIARAFEENGQLVPKHRCGVHYPILQYEHIQWLVERLSANIDITVECLHHQLNEAFQFLHHVSIIYVLQAI